jgi:hypothetical protein
MKTRAPALLTRHLGPSYSADHKSKLFSGTAKRVYRLA